ncbi:MAG TPA: ATP-binding protein [Pyrinomonadaceae bacterium]|nr:ATP-binding protein [Pyrinomonadaceae bacterium]
MSSAEVHAKPAARPVELGADLYREIFAHSREAIAIIDPNGLYLQQNGAHFTLLGYSDDDLEGQTPALDLGAKTFADIRRDLAESGEYSGEIICRTKSGEELNIELTVFTMRSGLGEPLCYVSIKRDITSRAREINARRRTEQRLALQYAITRILSRSIDFVEGTHEILQTVCESLGWQVGVLWAVDHQGDSLRCIDFWHEPSLNLDGFESMSRKRTFTRGLSLPGRIWDSGKPAWIPEVSKDPNFPRAALATQAGLSSAFGFPILLGDEVVGVMEFFSQQTRQPDQDLNDMIVSVGFQIGQFHERKRAEEKLAHLLVRERAARADAEKANRLKDEFLATLSHELRTPLNAVIGWSRILKSGRLDNESSIHAMDVIERNAWAQKQIIEDILDVSRVITGKLQLHLTPIDLTGVVNAALDAVRPALEAKDIRVEMQYEQNLRVIAGDADRLQQVVWNLLSNASKFTPAGGTVGIRVTEDETYATIEISDTGPGIAPEFLPHVFERFSQADGSTTRTHGGLGLGLAIVRHLVELHGGLIGVENVASGPGAVFRVKLPLPNTELALEASPAATPFEDHLTETDLAGVHILVVEDDLDALDLITIDLAEHGAKVRGVVSASEALTLLNNEPFDLLISDIGMADTDGYNLIKQVRNQEKDDDQHIPAIALTAYARTQDRIRAIAAGYNTHVAKPVEIHELVTVVKCLTGRIA